MSRHLRVLLAGVLVIAPFAITISVVWWLGGKLDEVGRAILQPWEKSLPRFTGILVALAAIYLVGLATHVLVFRGLIAWVERVFQRLPGVKTVYTSIRDLMNLFGPSSARSGRVVEYGIPGQGSSMLGIVTNEHPEGFPHDGPDRKVAVYFPYAYMIGGPISFVSPEYLREVDMSVEMALRLCATAHVGSLPAAPVNAAAAQVD